MADLPRTPVRYYVVSSCPCGRYWRIMDRHSPCQKKIGYYTHDEAIKLVDEMNAAWRAATTPIPKE